MGFILQSFWRHWHRTIAMLIVLPFFLTASTGLLLMTRSFNTWMQPQYPSSSGASLEITFSQMLTAAQSVPEAKVRSWADISQIDIRPATGQIRLRSKHDNWELQVDSVTGLVIKAAPRRVGFITALHEGAYFGSVVRYGIFFPSAIGVIFLIFSGLLLFFQPLLRKFRAKRD